MAIYLLKLKKKKQNKIIKKMPQKNCHKKKINYLFIYKINKWGRGSIKKKIDLGQAKKIWGRILFYFVIIIFL